MFRSNITECVDSPPSGRDSFDSETAVEFRRNDPDSDETAVDGAAGAVGLDRCSSAVKLEVGFPSGHFSGDFVAVARHIDTRNVNMCRTGWRRRAGRWSKRSHNKP